MSYVVLARKYRSRNFSEMVGQEHVVQALRNALVQQRLHHAYLFTGTRGVGKTTVSRILAKSLNCVGPDGAGGITSEPCGVCQPCRDIDAGRFVDYTELDAASNRGVEEVQGLLEQAVYKPVQGRFKVFMIDEVHMLSAHAFNAMLKTLEEPPDYLKFVLATTDPQKVPVTVLSRCLQFNLRPMAPETIETHLQDVLSQEGIGAEAAALALIARAARGSMRDALSLTDQAIAFGAGAVREPDVRQMMGVVGRGQVLALAAALAVRQGAEVVRLVDSMREEGLSAGAVLEDLAGLMQSVAVLQVTQAQPHHPDAATLLDLAGSFKPDEVQFAYSMALHGRTELGLAPDEHAALCMVLLRVLAFLAPAEKKSLDRPRESLISPPPQQQPPASVLPAKPPALSPVAPRLPKGDWVPVRSASTSPSVLTPADGAPEGPPGATVPAPGLVVEIPVRSATQGSADREKANAEIRITPTAEGDFWAGLVADLVAREAITAMARELALQSQLVGRDDAQWLLRVERETLNQEGSRERLRNALRAAGHEVGLAVEIGVVRDSPAKRLAAEAAMRQQEAEALVMQDPFIQQMMREFGARIVPGSLKPI